MLGPNIQRECVKVKEREQCISSGRNRSLPKVVNLSHSAFLPTHLSSYVYEVL